MFYAMDVRIETNGASFRAVKRVSRRRWEPILSCGKARCEMSEMEALEALCGCWMELFVFPTYHETEEWIVKMFGKSAYIDKPWVQALPEETFLECKFGPHAEPKEAPCS